jgi:hypothetical protein
VAKDRAAPFSKKHRRYWIPILGGMIVIGGINLGLGFCAYPGEKALYRTPEQIVPVLPNLHPDGGGPMPDAGSGSGSGSGSVPVEHLER